MYGCYENGNKWVQGHLSIPGQNRNLRDKFFGQRKRGHVYGYQQRSVSVQRWEGSLKVVPTAARSDAQH